MAGCLKQSIVDKTVTFTLEYTASYVIPFGFGYEDAYSCSFTYSIAERDKAWLACPPEDIAADLDPGEMIFLNERHPCCPNTHAWFYKILDGYQDAGTRTNVWYGGGSPPFDPPTYQLGAVGSIQAIALKHCRKGEGNVTFFMVPASEDNLEDTAPTIAIETQANSDDLDTIAEFSIIYDGSGSHFDGASDFSWTDPLGNAETIHIERTLGNAGEWWPFGNVTCDKPAACEVARVTDGFLFKLLDKKYAGLTIEAPELVSNTMQRAEYVRGSNHAHAQIDIYKRNYDGDGNVLPGIDTTFLWAQFSVGDVIAEDAEEGFSFSGEFSGTMEDGTTYSGTVTMVME